MDKMLKEEFGNGRLAQLDRALVSGTRGRGFESRIAHHRNNQGFSDFQDPFIFTKNFTPNTIPNNSDQYGAPLIVNPLAGSKSPYPAHCISRECYNAYTLS